MTHSGMYHRKEGSLVGGLILVGIGTYFLLRELGILTVGLGRLWPVILIIVGVALIIGHFHESRHSHRIGPPAPPPAPPGD